MNIKVFIYRCIIFHRFFNAVGLYHAPTSEILRDGFSCIPQDSLSSDGEQERLPLFDLKASHLMTGQPTHNK